MPSYDCESIFCNKKSIFCHVVAWSYQPERDVRRPRQPFKFKDSEAPIPLGETRKMYASLPEDMPLERQMSNLGASMANQPWPDETLGL